METVNSGGQRRRAGRPLSFDRDAALHAAMLVFWRHGYEATALSDLTAAMGVTPPSIYGAFGNKKALFLEAVRRYVGEPAISHTIIADAPSARLAAQGLLDAAARGFTGSDTPAGCLLASATAACSADAADVQAEITTIRRGIQTRLRDRLDAGVKAGELPAAIDTTAVAAHIIAVIQGMSTLARDGASREALQRVATVAMCALAAGAPDSRPI